MSSSGGVRHVVLFTWRDTTTTEQVEAVATALRRLPEVIPGIRRFELGADLAINDGNADFAVVADFASLEDYLAYRDHPEHRAVVTDVIAPLLASRTAVQHRLDP